MCWRDFYFQMPDPGLPERGQMEIKSKWVKRIKDWFGLQGPPQTGSWAQLITPLSPPKTFNALPITYTYYNNKKAPTNGYFTRAGTRWNSKSEQTDIIKVKTTEARIKILYNFFYFQIVLLTFKFMLFAT